MSSGGIQPLSLPVQPAPSGLTQGSLQLLAYRHVYPHMLVHIPEVWACLSEHTSISFWIILILVYTHTLTYILTRVLLYMQFTHLCTLPYVLQIHITHFFL